MLLDQGYPALLWINTMFRKKILIAAHAFFGFTIALGGTVTAKADDLVVVIENLKSDQGNVRVAIFDSSKNFPRIPIQAQSVVAKSGSVSVTFKALPTGQYAVSAFQDLNSNQKLDTNFVGMPIEPYGFSRDAQGRFGPPSFQDATIQINDTSEETIRIQLQERSSTISK